MPIGEGGRPYPTEMKKSKELKSQLKETQKTLNDTSEDEASLVPPSIKQGEILKMPITDIKEKYSRRYEMYLDLLRENRAEEQGRQYVSEEEVAEMRKWLGALNSLDDYIENHKAKKEQTLRERQLTVFEDLRKFVEKGGEAGYIKLPTGVGKTVLFTEFIEALDLRTLIVVPTRLLVDQTEEKFEEFAPDLDVGKVYNRSKEFGRQVTIITYDSLLRAKNINPEDYDCIILDEVHQSLSEKRMEVVNKFSNALRLGFTATPEYSSDKKVSNLLETEIHGMEIPEAVQEGLLCSFSAIVAETQVDLSSVPVLENGEYNEKELGKAVNISGRNESAIELYKANFMGELAVAYCVGIEHAKQVAKTFEMAGVRAGYISGNMGTEEQKEVIRQFKNREIQVLCNADILIAGFDEPQASTCLNLRPTRSKVVAEQRGGRVLRINPNNPHKHSVIVDFFDKHKSERYTSVLFADVAGGVNFISGGKPDENRQSGGGGDSPGMRASIIEVPGIKVITDTEEVMKIVRNKKDADEEKEQEREKEFLSFSELEKAVRAAGISSKEYYQKQYKNYPGWPSKPDATYKDEWKGWPAFLGKEVKIFLSFTELQKEVRVARIQSSGEYFKEYKSHTGWSSVPHITYKNEWTSWPEFLGTVEKFLTFSDLQKEVRAAGITSSTHYREARQHHPNWPSDPGATYKHEWPSGGWREFLGTEKESQFLTFSDLQKEVREAGIKSNVEYSKEYKSHMGWPSSPSVTYKNEWRGWYEFLGTVGVEKESQFLAFSDLQKEVRAAQITTRQHYTEVYKNHPGWPSAPDGMYKNEWRGWYEFLGTERENQFLTFSDLQNEVRAAQITSSTHYYKVCKLHLDWPSAPDDIYRDEWTNWFDFLGKEVKNFLSFIELRKQVRAAQIKSSPHYFRVRKLHLDWPSAPELTYKDDWPSGGWREFLGTLFLPLDTLQKEARSTGIRTQREYKEKYKDHAGWPGKPDEAYKKEWKGWTEFLGTVGVEKESQFLAFFDLQKEVRAAQITSSTHYYEVRKHHPGWPSSPDATYKDKWPPGGWREFLGTEREGQFLTFSDLQEQVRAANISNREYYKKQKKNHPNWPSDPADIYKHEWPSGGWREFLGTENQFLTLSDLQEQVRVAGIRSQKQYTEQYKNHPGWPSTPAYTYKDEWKGWVEFFGKEVKIFLSFTELQKEVRAAQIKSGSEYSNEYKSHIGWTSVPEIIYKDEWKSWPEFLGKEVKLFLSFTELQTEVRGAGILSRERYKEQKKNHPNWPSDPQLTYKEEWKGWSEFLGKK